MKIKKYYLKKKYMQQRTEVLLHFSNNFCSKADKTRYFQSLCLKNHLKPMFLPSSFGLGSSSQAQGPYTSCIFARGLGFSEIAFAENLKEILSVAYKKRSFFYMHQNKSHESTKNYAQSFLYLLSMQNKK